MENIFVKITDEDYSKREIKNACNYTLNRYQNYVKEFGDEEYICIEDLFGLIEDLNYEIDHLNEKIEDLQREPEPEDNTYSGGIYE